MSRGDGREAIFYDDADRVEFLRTLGQACRKSGWQVHAYCLMNNHFHLVVERPRANLVEGMKWLLGTYTMRFNRRHKLSGHLFAGRYKSLLIDGATSGYSRAVCDHVILNPVRARLLRKRERLQKAPLE
jgi:putative transposase